MSKVEAVLEHEEDINNIECKYDKLLIFIELEKDLNKLKYDFKRINEHEKELSFIQECNTTQVEALVNKLKEFLLLQNQLDNLKNKIIKNKKQSQKIQNEINENIQKYADILQDIGKCPICLTDIGDDVISHIEEELKLKEVEV
jgi:DNA repair protein SbcC/Rad50